MMAFAPSTTNRQHLYRMLMAVRPAQAADMLKSLLRIRRRNLVTELGYTFHVDPVSVFGNALMDACVYEPGLTRVFCAVLRRGDAVIDLGANEGYFSVLAGSLVGPDGCVHCIEPQSRLQTILRNNLAANCIHNVT